MTEEPNGRVTSRQVYRLVDDTKELLRADIRIVEGRVDSINEKVDRVVERLDAKPGRLWLAGRTTAVIDRMLPLGLVALITWLLTQAA